MSRTVTATCVLDHRKTFRGWFIDHRVERWFAKHAHPEAFVEEAASPGPGSPETEETP